MKSRHYRSDGHATDIVTARVDVSVVAALDVVANVRLKSRGAVVGDAIAYYLMAPEQRAVIREAGRFNAS